jgi:hypothetical protein
MTKLLIVAGCATALAACGSSSTSASSSVTTDPGVWLAQCMRAHGVPNFPDPSPGGGVKLTPASGIDPQSPSFQAAQRDCKQYAPAQGGPPTMSATERQHAVVFAECMRSHGQPDFPDPTIGAVTPATTGRALALRGMFFAVGPAFNPKSPAFKHAASSCGLRLP